MIRNYVAFIGLFFFLQSNAQYLNELNLFVGGTNYSGDIGNELYIYPNNIGGSLVYKRNFDSRLSGRITYSYFPISDDDANSFNAVRQNRALSFSNTIHELSVGIEFNYFDYDVMSVYKGYTPYIFLDFAGIYSKERIRHDSTSSELRNSISYVIPFGIGYKSRITDRLGYSLELRTHYTFSDNLDSDNTAVSVIEYENLNTNDWYFFTGFSLVYSFGRPPCFAPRQ